MDQFLNSFSLHGNWVDLAFVLVVLYFLFTNRGFLDTMLDVVGFVLALIFSYRLYNVIGRLLVYNFALPNGISNAIGFFIAWFFLEMFIFIVTTLLSIHVFDPYKKNPLNRGLGYLAGFIQAVVIFLFFISLIFAFPVKGQIKRDILESKTGPFFVNLSQYSELRLKNIFGGAISETINFLTIKPQSNETIDLGFKANSSQLHSDETSEETLLNLVNKERTSRGLHALKLDTSLRSLARNYAVEMLENGFFAHVSQVDGSSPGDRANRANIEYTVLGENLAYAPDVYIAHQGLMNSEGHRKNILSPEYGRVGIGVIDAGYYGKMFVQEFAD
jgi:uncharacterized protein YkwD